MCIRFEEMFTPLDPLSLLRPRAHAHVIFSFDPAPTHRVFPAVLPFPQLIHGVVAGYINSNGQHGGSAFVFVSPVYSVGRELEE